MQKYNFIDPPKGFGKYTPNLNKILTCDKSIYTVELHKGNLRIIRLLNKRRAHDFIIGDFKDLQVYIENSNSGSRTLQLESVDDLMELFKDKSFYLDYKRSFSTDEYTVVESSKTSLKHLINIWQSQLTVEESKKEPVS